jgi:hypothetical protein
MAPRTTFTVADAARIVQSQPGLYILKVEHDDDCPALRTQRMEDCRCRPNYRLIKTTGRAK